MATLHNSIIIDQPSYSTILMHTEEDDDSPDKLIHSKINHSKIKPLRPRLGDPDYENLLNYQNYLPNCISQTDDLGMLKKKVKDMTLAIRGLELKIDQSPVS